MRTIGIFSGSSYRGGIGSVDSTIVSELRTIAQQLPLDYRVAYGGGDSGLMGIIPTEYASRGGDVVGYNAAMFVRETEASNAYPGIQLTYDTFEERQSNLIRSSDIILALPGGVGTTYEILDVFVKNDLNLWEDHTRRSVILYNYRGHYSHFVSYLHNAQAEGFLKPHVLDYMYVVTGPNQLLDVIETIAHSPNNNLSRSTDCK